MNIKDKALYGNTQKLVTLTSIQLQIKLEMCLEGH